MTSRWFSSQNQVLIFVALVDELTISWKEIFTCKAWDTLPSKANWSCCCCWVDEWRFSWFSRKAAKRLCNQRCLNTNSKLPHRKTHDHRLNYVICKSIEIVKCWALVDFPVKPYLDASVSSFFMKSMLSSK